MPWTWPFCKRRRGASLAAKKALEESLEAKERAAKREERASKLNLALVRHKEANHFDEILARTYSAR
jgi:hypothetical protein